MRKPGEADQNPGFPQFSHQTHAVENTRQVWPIRRRIAHLHHQVSGIPASPGPEGFILLSSKLLLGSKPCAVQRCRAIELPLRGFSEFFRINLIDRGDSLAAHCILLPRAASGRACPSSRCCRTSSPRTPDETWGHRSSCNRAGARSIRGRRLLHAVSKKPDQGNREARGHACESDSQGCEERVGQTTRALCPRHVCGP